MSTEIHAIYSTHEHAPYESLQILGGGSSGVVDRVRHRNSGKSCARKSILIRPIGGSQREQAIRKIKEEARIIRRLRNNPHMVEVVSTYEIEAGYRPTFCILLLPIADRDLRAALDHIDQLSEGEEKNNAIRTMKHWAACLVRATDYMHYNCVKHKDIKPTNILVRGDEVYITDFGIAKEFLLDNSESTAVHVDGTRRYCPPEALNHERRGRASDIFSLGCCFLEMATVMITCGKLDILKPSVGVAYAEVEEHVLRWIYYLFSELAFRWVRRYKADGEGPDSSTSGDDLVLRHAVLLPSLAFVMMDPTASTRITARQLVTLVSVWAKYMYCDKCKLGVPDEDPTLGLHSKFKTRRELKYPQNPEDILEPTFPIPRDWEDAKALWLKDHMWWS